MGRIGEGVDWEEVGEAVRSWRDHSSNLNIYIPDTLCFFLYTNRYTPKETQANNHGGREGGVRVKKREKGGLAGKIERDRGDE